MKVKKEKNNIEESKKDKFWKNKKFIIILLSVVAIILITTIVIIVNKKNYGNGNTLKNNTNYEEIMKLINDKDDGIIYYYNSNSSNSANKEIKEYLDELKLRYYPYNDVYVDKNEYNKFLEILNIDKDLFGMPAIIYIKDGMMYGNIINIDSEETVKRFIDDYDLYTVK